MSKEKPILSIVIPTKNRFSYVKSAIQSILDINSDAIQLVVQDNSDTDTLRSWVLENIKDIRLIYNYTKDVLSMVENYDRSFEFVNGLYVSYIGDDDGVTTQIIDAAMIAHEYKLDALIPSSLINYVWPDLNMDGKYAMKAGELRIRSFSSNSVVVDPEAELYKCMKDAGQSFHRLPKAYYGIVRTACLEKLMKETGSCFPGISPDMAAAVGLTKYVKRVIFTDYPIFVPGSSGNSNAGLSGLNKHIGILEQQKHLDASHIIAWNNMVPRFYSVQTIWAQAVIGALEATGRAGKVEEFNYSRLYALCYQFHPRYMRQWLLKAVISTNWQNVLLIMLGSVWYYIEWWAQRVKNFINRKIRREVVNKGFFIAYNQLTIFDAVKTTNQAMKLTREVWITNLANTVKQFPAI